MQFENINSNPFFLTSVQDIYNFGWFDYWAGVVDEFPIDNNDVAELSFLDCFNWVPSTNCSCLNHTIDQATECSCSNPPQEGGWQFDPYDCPEAFGVTNLFLQSGNGGDPTPPGGNGSGGGGSWGSNNSAPGAIFYNLRMGLSHFFDQNSNQNLAQINSQLSDVSDCPGILNEMLVLITASDEDPVIIAKMNCAASTLTIDSETGDCDVNYPSSVEEAEMAKISDTNLEWAIDYTSNNCPTGGYFKNPICDMIAQGFPGEIVNQYIHDIRVVLHEEPDGPSSGYNIGEGLDICQVNSITEGVLNGSVVSYPNFDWLPEVCYQSFDNYTETGFGATIMMPCNMEIVFILAFEGVGLECYGDLGDLCIEVGQYEFIDGEIPEDEDGNLIPISMLERKRASAKAFDATRKKFLDENNILIMEGNSMMSDIEARSFYRTILEEELNTRMTSCTVSNGPCSGDIGVGERLEKVLAGWWIGGCVNQEFDNCNCPF